MYNKRKIINDPVYGFINIPTDFIYDIVQEPIFQRLRRIKQLGLTDLVYPGALHTRFNHALGAMSLMSRTLERLRQKGHMIYDTEAEAVLIAGLLHDIGHGPFSHTLEYGLLEGVNHEDLTLLMMEYLNRKHKGTLSLAIDIFKGVYHRQFLHELVSSQLDMDRMDYLKRDSYFTGVSEGSIGVDRIIQMLNVVDDHLVVEEKGIYSIENFLSARRLMYWQVYLHKTAVSADRMLNGVIARAKQLYSRGRLEFIAKPLESFLAKKVSLSDFEAKESILEEFATLDDHDVWHSLKQWARSEDKVLSFLSNALLNRELFQIIISNEKPSKEIMEALKSKIINGYGIKANEVQYLLSSGTITNSAYISGGDSIRILMKNGGVQDIAKAADLPNIKAMSKIVRKYYLCWPKNISLPAS